jgi:NAD(P)-dependent dehydrogenase (short-subunit alcohol dehydrogenase family)
LRVVVAGRTAERLRAAAASICSSGGSVVVKVADASREADVTALFDEAAGENDLELVVYNVGNNFAAPALETQTKLFEDLWRQNALGGFLVGREAVRRFAPRQRGTILFTGATASLRARPPFLAFASAKAALRAVAQGLAREFGPQGIHVAHIVIDGAIQGEYAATKFADYVRPKGENGLLSVEAIAEAYLAMHRQPPSAWTHELDLRPFKEPF